LNKEVGTVPALFINIRIDSQEKFEFFKVTFSDIANLFDECHIKFRGRCASDCVEFVRQTLKGDVHFYQDLQETDWVAASLEMIKNIKARSLFIYFEDHKLLADPSKLRNILDDFDRCELDYLCYSFFRASQLEAQNLLPLDPHREDLFHSFRLTPQKLPLLGKISPNYYTFSLASMASLRYFQSVLSAENKPIKIFHRLLTSLFLRLFPYPGNRAATRKMNNFLSIFKMRIGVYPPATPFNLENIWFETSEPPLDGWKMGVPFIELFANYDDDNGSYKESLIKRGLYPLDGTKFHSKKLLPSISNQISLNAGQTYDCTYFSHQGRITNPPLVEIQVLQGHLQVSYQNSTSNLTVGNSQLFYANLNPVIKAIETSNLLIKISDENF